MVFYGSKKKEEFFNIFRVFNKSGKYYNCLFECANEKTFIDCLMQKRTKILHISSHGDLDDKDKKFFLKLEDKVKTQFIKYDKLERILKTNSSKIKNIDLVFVSACHSEGLGKLFIKYGAKNVIYIQSQTPISDKVSLKFSEYFYEELIKGLSIKQSYYKAQEKISFNREVILINQKNCCCDCHKHIDESECKNLHDEFHKRICNCFFSEFHFHKINCKFHQLINEAIITRPNFKISPPFIDIKNNYSKYLKIFTSNFF